jgi:hypothetical protein
MKNFQAKPEYWELQEQWSNHAILGVDSSCFLELRSRVEALEAKAGNYPATPDSSTSPPSLKEQALSALEHLALGPDPTAFLADMETIRRALEQLDD